MGSYFIVFIGGGLGAALRHAINRLAAFCFGPAPPYGTLVVNVSGSLLMGVLAQLFLAKGGGSPELRLFLATGLLGGFTTFSAFSLDAAAMLQRGDYSSLAGYVAASVFLSIAALFAGIGLVRALT